MLRSITVHQYDRAGRNDLPKTLSQSNEGDQKSVRDSFSADKTAPWPRLPDGRKSERKSNLREIAKERAEARLSARTVFGLPLEGAEYYASLP
jgi:hypothetical protein